MDETEEIALKAILKKWNMSIDYLSKAKFYVNSIGLIDKANKLDKIEKEIQKKFNGCNSIQDPIKKLDCFEDIARRE